MSQVVQDSIHAQPPRICLGFMALLDAAPLVVARERGFFAAQGLDVVLSRQSSWASLRDKVSAGLLDGGQMLAPMPLALALGLGAPATQVVSAMVLSRNGNGITLARRIAQQLPTHPDGDPLATAQALATVIRERGRPLRLATVYPWSSHQLQLLDWLAYAGLAPGDDIELTAIAPARMLEALREGVVDGCCVGEPWNSLAQHQGLGDLLVSGHEIWQNAPEKVLGMRADWVDAHPDLHQRLLMALVEACRWLDDPANHADLKGLLALPTWLDEAGAELAQITLGPFHPRIAQHFFRDQANFPWQSQARWLLDRLQHYGLCSELASGLAEATVETCIRPDLYRAAAHALGLDAPVIDGKTEGVHPQPFPVPGASGAVAVAGDALLGQSSFRWP